MNKADRKTAHHDAMTRNSRHAAACFRRYSWLAAAAGVFFPALAQAEMQPGLWEITVQAEMTGMQVPPSTTQHCYTKADVSDSRKALPVDSKCEVTESGHHGNTFSWKMRCNNPQEMTGSGTMTQDSTTYTGTAQIHVQGMDIKQQFTGKRLGDCAK